jgi:hypothetical protein
MLDQLFMKYLSKKGKISYWVGQISMVALFCIYFFGISENSLDESEGLFYAVIISILVGWGAVCLIVWPRSQDEEKEA